MSIQEGYTITQSFSKEQINELHKYITGPLCDLYGATTHLSYPGDDSPIFPKIYHIRRYNGLPLLPAVDTVLEITVEESVTNVEAYFYSKWKRNKVFDKLGKISGLELSPRPVAWKHRDIEEILASAQEGSYWMN